jgi:GNAT superfamily N-acetyltransferase
VSVQGAPVVVRVANPEDGPSILNLLRGLAEYEKLPGPSPDAESRLLEDAFGPAPRYKVLLASAGGRDVGLATWFETYSTFHARPILYLEDLFVVPDARGLGAGRALLARLAEEALAGGCVKMTWSVLHWNEPAIRFYEKLGAKGGEWILYGVEEPGLRRLAAGHSLR